MCDPGDGVGLWLYDVGGGSWSRAGGAWKEGTGVDMWLYIWE